MEQVSTGNILTMLTIAVGFVLQYIALIKSFTERITKIETEQFVKHERIDKDIELLTKDIRLLTSKIRDGDSYESHN